MTTQKRILVIGATGAMGQYLVPLLAKQGHLVDAVSLDDVPDTIPNVTYIKANAKDRSVYAELLGRHYDGVVDFLIFNTSELPYYLPTALRNSGHYIYLASYRVYDNKEVPIRETSPRNFETADDLWFRHSDDYAIYKARGEEMLKGSGYTNWTSIRPAITYSRMRYQLVTLEAPLTVGRAFRNKACVLPEEARNIQATMSWAGNAAQMIAGLLFNDKALRECFTISTSEHHTWGEIADYYRDICGLRSYWIPKEDYLSVWAPGPYNHHARWQLDYDRLFTRIIDNSKVLSVTGLRQEDFMPLYDGLKHEIARCPKDFPFAESPRMDDYIAAHGLE